MAHDTGLGIFLGQFLEQGVHRGLLSSSPCIGRAAFLIETSLITNTNRTAVVVAGMSTTDILRENRDNSTIATDVIVIGGLAEAGLTSRYQGFLAEGTVAASGTTVNY